MQSSQNVEEDVVENGDNDNSVEKQDENEEAPGKDLQDKTNGQKYVCYVGCGRYGMVWQGIL